jgi:hypothetical protein
MRVNRRLLYWGVVLLAIGGVLVLADLRSVDSALLTDLVRLWPLAIIAIGLSLVLRRTRFALAGLLAAALIPGIVVGAAFAVAPRFAGNCGSHGQLQNVASTEGSFTAPATVSIQSGCGVLNVATTDGDGWTLDAANTSGVGPDIDATESTLSIREPHGRNFLDAGRNEWDITLPTLPQADINHLSIAITTGDGDVDLAGGSFESLDLTANAGQLVVDASESRGLQSVSGDVNVGAMSLSLPGARDLTTDLSVDLEVGAGRIEVCTPPDLGLMVSSDSDAGRVAIAGLEQASGNWQSPNYGSAAHRAHITVHVSFGAVDVNPIGGCNS